MGILNQTWNATSNAVSYVTGSSAAPYVTGAVAAAGAAYVAKKAINHFRKSRKPYPEMKVPQNDQLLLDLEKSVKPSGCAAYTDTKTWAPAPRFFWNVRPKALIIKEDDSKIVRLMKNVARYAIRAFAVISIITIPFTAAFGVGRKLYKENLSNEGIYARRILNLIDTEGYSPELIKGVQEQAGINVNIAVKNRKEFMKAIRELKNWKSNLSKEMQQVISEIAQRVMDTDPEHRQQAFRDILGHFFSQRGHDNVTDDERRDVARRIANGVVEEVARNHVDDLLGDIDQFHAVMDAPDALDHASLALQNAFGLDPDGAAGLLSEELRQRILDKYKSKDRFLAAALGKDKEFINEIFHSQRSRLEVIITDLEILHNKLAAEIETLRRQATSEQCDQDANQMRKIIKEHLEKLNEELKKNAKKLNTANEEKRVVAKGGKKRYGMTIGKSKVELAAEIDALTREGDDLADQIQHYNRLLRAVNNGKHVNLKLEEMKIKQAQDKKVMESLKDFRERLMNLPYKNARELAAFEALVQVIAQEGGTIPDKGKRLNAMMKRVANKADLFETALQREKRKWLEIFGLKGGVKLSRYDSLVETFNKFGPDSVAAKAAFGELYRGLAPRQKAYLSRVVATTAGRPGGIGELVSGAQADFGRRYIEAYIQDNPPSVDGVSVRASVIQRSINSSAGKNAAEDKTYSSYLMPFTKSIRDFAHRRFDTVEAQRNAV